MASKSVERFKLQGARMWQTTDDRQKSLQRNV